MTVTPGLGDLLGVRPVLGRPLLPSDAEETAAAVALISHELWQERWGATPPFWARPFASTKRRAPLSASCRRG
jgi:hypothetical protein